MPAVGSCTRAAPAAPRCACAGNLRVAARSSKYAKLIKFWQARCHTPLSAFSRRALPCLALALALSLLRQKLSATFPPFLCGSSPPYCGHVLVPTRGGSSASWARLFIREQRVVQASSHLLGADSRLAPSAHTHWSLSLDPPRAAIARPRCPRMARFIRAL
eukprot:6182584-Pleurochrysis_carterae.AAC.2